MPIKSFANLTHSKSLLNPIDGANIFLWNTSIRTRAHTESPQEAILVYKQMLHQKIVPNSHTYPYLLSAINRLSVSILYGQTFHTHVIKFGLESNPFVANSLMNMYSKIQVESNGLVVAQKLFDEMPERDLVSWNVMVGAYVRGKRFKEVFLAFERMAMEDNLKGNEVTMVSLLTACTHLGDIETGRQIHRYIEEEGITFNEIVGNSLIDMYAKCGSIDNARSVFDRLDVKKNVVAWNSMISGYCRFGMVDVARTLFDQMLERNVISWTSMIAGYVQNNLSLQALTLFRLMGSEGLEPDEVLMASLLSACADLGALSHGRSIHVCLIKKSIHPYGILGSALIDMYAKCGKIDLAILVFMGIAERDVNPWTAVITGLALNGKGRACLEIFSRMELEKVRPNEITFVGILCGCSHGGLVDEGLHQFRRMNTVYKITPQIEHYGCMVDLLGRAGRLKQALDFIENMPIDPNAGVWGALLGACRIHGDVEIAERAATVLIELEPLHSGRYVILSNIYAAANRWDEADNVRMLMKDRGVEKEYGWSSIEVDGIVNQFSVGDRSHVQFEEIHLMLEGISKQLKMIGYLHKQATFSF